MPAGRMVREMTEQELIAWHRFAQRRGLPTRRIERMLAQLTMWVAASAGAKNARLEDFLLDPPDDPDPDAPPLTEDEQVEQAMIAFGYNPQRGTH